MNPRERFINACRSEATDRTPVWFLGQAGPYLPEFRQLLAANSNGQSSRQPNNQTDKPLDNRIYQNPELAAELSVLPVERFGLDAALPIATRTLLPEAMGQRFRVDENGELRAQFSIRSQADLERLNLRDLELRLGSTAKILRLIRRQIGPERALIGYCQTPWAIASLMIETKTDASDLPNSLSTLPTPFSKSTDASRDFLAAKRLFFEERTLYERLARRATQAVARFLQLQIAAGVDAIYLEDQASETLGPDALFEASAAWTRRVIGSVKGQVPVLIAAGKTAQPHALAFATHANGIAAGPGARLAELRRQLPPDCAVMGNLDPALLTTSKRTLEREALRILEDMRGVHGYLFNLSGPIPDHADPDLVAHLAQIVANFA